MFRTQSITFFKRVFEKKYIKLFGEPPCEDEVRAMLALLILSHLEYSGHIPYPAKIRGGPGGLRLEGSLSSENLERCRLQYLRDHVSDNEVDLFTKLIGPWRKKPAPDFFRNASARSRFAEWLQKGEGTSIVDYAEKDLMLDDDEMFCLRLRMWCR